MQGCLEWSFNGNLYKIESIPLHDFRSFRTSNWLSSSFFYIPHVVHRIIPTSFFYVALSTSNIHEMEERHMWICLLNASLLTACVLILLLLLLSHICSYVFVAVLLLWKRDVHPWAHYSLHVGVVIILVLLHGKCSKKRIEEYKYLLREKSGWKEEGESISNVW